MNSHEAPRPGRWLRRRALAAVALSVVFSVVLGWFGMAWQAADTCLRPMRFVARTTPASMHLKFEEVGFRASDGVPIRGWFIPAQRCRGVVILGHGFPGNRGGSLQLLPFLHRAGFSLLSFDFRGMGSSGGDHSTMGYEEVRDVAGAVVYLRRRADTRRAPIGILGRSMGAAIAILAGAQLHEIQAVVADSPYASLDQVMLEAQPRPSTLVGRLQRRTVLWFVGYTIGVPAADVAPVQAARRLAPRALLLIHCLRDRNIAPQHSRAIFAAAGRPKELWLIPNAPHCAAYNVARRDYERRVVHFFQHAFRAAPH